MMIVKLFYIASFKLEHEPPSINGLGVDPHNSSAVVLKITKL